MPGFVLKGGFKDTARIFLRGAYPPGLNDGQIAFLLEGDIDRRLHAAYGWLQQAFLAADKFGFSMGFHLFSGWKPAYPETSGYIISSLLKYERSFGSDQAELMASAAADWLLTIQNPDGGIPAMGKTAGPSLAFDTGMVLHGFTDLYLHTGNAEVAAAARRCAQYLCATQQPDGSWPNCYKGMAHAYHARVSWPLLLFAHTFHDEEARLCAVRNLDWVVSLQGKNGYWEKAFFTRRIPFANTHSLGYILEGLLEAYLLEGKSQWLAGARLAADTLISRVMAKNGFLPGYLDASWREVKVLPYSFACLTGIAQIARSWLLLNKISAEKKYIEAARLAARYVSFFQDIETESLEIRGALPGSAPIAGGYLPFQYPNWAVKFWMDVLFDLKELHPD